MTRGIGVAGVSMIHGTGASDSLLIRGSMIRGSGDRPTGRGILTIADGTEAGDRDSDGTVRATYMEGTDATYISGTGARQACEAQPRPQTRDTHTVRLYVKKARSAHL